MPRLNIKTRKQFLEKYETTAKEYDIARSSTQQGKIIDQLQREFIYNKIKQNNYKKILEAGCGTGRILIFLAKKGLNCYGFDPAKNMLKEFKSKIKNKKLKISLKEGKIEKIPFPSNTFDCTFTMHVLMHMPDYKKAVKEMYRVTKKGGIVICDFPNYNSPWTLISLFLNPRKKRTQLFKISELRKFFKAYDYTLTGLFSYARTFYKISILRNIFFFLERLIPLPVWMRTQLFVIVKKK